MILQSLVEYYESLAERGEISRQGWCSAKVSYCINLRKDGTVQGIIPLKQERASGKKTIWVPQSMEVPEMVSRSSGIKANFLCDNSKFLLGIDKDGAGGRVEKCFAAAKQLHLELLETASGEMAEAVKSFFRTWSPEQAKNCEEIVQQWDDITSGTNLIFGMGIFYAHDDTEIREAWDKRNLEKEENGTEDDEREGICLATGMRTEIARIHPVIKGIPGAQSSGAPLVSFNESAFESYGKKQSYNAPVGKYAVFAYTTALNYLLAQRDYVFHFGDTTVVFWSESGEEEYQDVFRMISEPTVDNQEILRSIFAALSKGEPFEIDKIELDWTKKFCILGLAPNAARLSVQFFYEKSFGNILNNYKLHYERMEIVRPTWEDTEYLGVERMLQETVNQKSKGKKPRTNMTAGVLRAILSDGRYPESLYSNVLIRIRAEQGNEKVTMGRAAIIKAYLLKKQVLTEEELFVGLNEESQDVAYNLGRIFAVLETVQEEASQGINTTIRDKYFNSACATPAVVFPVLFKLKNSHIRKFDKQKEGKKIYYENLLTELQGKLDSYPRRLNLEEEGKFILGYYHQMQKRYEKKEEK